MKITNIEVIPIYPRLAKRYDNRKGRPIRYRPPHRLQSGDRCRNRRLR